MKNLVIKKGKKERDMQNISNSLKCQKNTTCKALSRAQS